MTSQNSAEEVLNLHLPYERSIGNYLFVIFENAETIAIKNTFKRFVFNFEKENKR